MHPGWSADFSYAYFRKLLHTVRSHFTAHRLSEAPKLLHTATSPLIFLRHDVKISLSRALRMAEIEHEYGLPATYMVRSDSPLYSLDDRNTRRFLWEILQLGHEVALHLEVSINEPQDLLFLRIVEQQLHIARKKIEEITKQPVLSLSFHHSIPQLLGGPLLIDGLVNADALPLQQWIISDNAGIWRDGEPISTIATPKSPILQLVIQPIWWGEHHLSAPERLQEFFDSATWHKSPQEASVFDINLARTIPPVRRQGIYALVGGGKKA